MASPVSTRPSAAFQPPRRALQNNPQSAGNPPTQVNGAPQGGSGQRTRGGGAGQPGAPQDIPQGGLDPRTNFIVTQRFRGRRGPNPGDQPGQNPPGAVNPGQPNNPAGNASGEISADRLNQAAGGNQRIVQSLQRVAQNPEGARALSIALSKGTTFTTGQLEGNTAGITSFATGRPPAITLERLETDVVAHEVAHAAFPNMDHEAVYEFGRQVARSLGETPIT
ncbi:MAG: hypothetical protein K0Q50_1783 [Vampirovibrio sp.]|nr:hypothetical protein [Vampirovibrio sp.]